MSENPKTACADNIRSFRAMHEPGNPFVLANAWDVGSAKMLAAMGAQAIGTSSAALAFTLGKADMGDVTREESVTHTAALVEAVNVPVSADLENGYGDTAEHVAATIREIIASGASGGSIEDIAAPTSDPYPFSVAVERIEAAVAVARDNDPDFVLTARADGVMLGKYDLAEAIRRIQAYERVGVNVVYVPMPADLAEIATICRSVTCPVNALSAGQFLEYSIDDFASAGVARISLGSSLARAVHRTIHDCAEEVFNSGKFLKMKESISGDKVEQLIGV